MAYIPTTWVDRIVDQDNKVIARGTPLSALNFNHLETGVAEAHESIQEVKTEKASVSSLETVANRVTVTEQKLDTATEKIADLEDEVEGINADLEQQAVKISTLQTTTGTHTTDIEALNTNFTAMKGGAPASTTLKSLSDAIGAITNGSGSGVSLQSLKSELEDANDSLEELQTALATAKSEHTADINAIKGGAATNVTLSSLNSSITALKGGADSATTLQSLKTQISTTNTNLTSLETSLNAAKTQHSTDITALKGGAADDVTLQSLKTGLTSATTTIGQHTTSISSLQTTTSTHTSDITAIKGGAASTVTLNSLNTAINGIKGNAASTVTLASLKATIDSLDSALVSLTSKVTALETWKSSVLSGSTAVITKYIPQGPGGDSTTS